MGCISAKSFFVTWQASQIAKSLGVPLTEKLRSVGFKGSSGEGIDLTLVDGVLAEIEPFDQLVPYALLEENYDIVYAVSSYEFGQETGAIHLHMYIRFKQTVTSAFLQRCLPGADTRRAKGNVFQALDYIAHTGKHRSKRGLLRLFEPHGDIANCRESRFKNGHDSVQFSEIFDRLDNGESLLSIVRDFPVIGIRYYCSLSKMYSDVRSYRKDKGLN